MAEIDTTIEEMLEPYPDTVKKNRKKHLIVKNEGAECCPQIEANTRTIPGIISQRGCAYAGCKGVVVGPI
jgi:nitrogenase molybdenum-iron protein alpha chain